MASPIKNNPFTAEQHLKFFAEFVKGVQLAGGTTPHMLMAVEAASRETSIDEQLWWAGCYAFVYNFASAEIIYQHWSPDIDDHVAVESWLIEHKPGIKRRKERKAVYSAKNLATCMLSYANYLPKVTNREWFLSKDLHGSERYQMAFDDLCKEVKYMGRYIAIRWLEVVRRLYNLDMEMPDLRARDGDHPRKAMALIYPEYESELMGGNTGKDIAVTDTLAFELLETLQHTFKTKTDYYTIQSLLCEYKQSCLGKRQYPGKSVDTALVYWNKIYEYWGDENKADSIMPNVRRVIFPKETLGELQGWNGVRKELGTVLVNYGYTWSDYVYDYIATEDLSDPVFRYGKRTIL